MSRRPKLDRPLRILQVSTLDIAGGAEKVAWNLFQAYRARGQCSRLAVGHKRSADRDALLIPNDVHRKLLGRVWLLLDKWLRMSEGKAVGIQWLYYRLALIAEPCRLMELWQGIEDFNFPGTSLFFHALAQPPDIIHCHNLHGDYFDLRVLPWLSQQGPVVLTLHDAWLLSGHCAHSFECERWKTGCGHCPDLTIYPAIRKDATAYNWQRKSEIYAKSRLYVATPSQWLMQKVEQSMLTSAIMETRVIPNGVDLSVFRPADRQTLRTALGIPQNARVLLFAANGIRGNIWKDYQTMRAAVALIAERLSEQNVLFIALGEKAPMERIGQAKICFVPYQKDPEGVARYYQAADVYVHAARADTFPNTILEALACGTPVVATAVGGIPEQIEDGVSGFLTPPGDAEAIAARVVGLLADEETRRRLAHQAAEFAEHRFDLNRQVDDYLAWYEGILEQWGNVVGDKKSYSGCHL